MTTLIVMHSMDLVHRQIHYEEDVSFCLYV